MRLVSEGNGLWGVDHNGERVVTRESYQVASNVCEPAGHSDECQEVRERILNTGGEGEHFNVE